MLLLEEYKRLAKVFSSEWRACCWQAAALPCSWSAAAGSGGLRVVPAPSAAAGKRDAVSARALQRPSRLHITRPRLPFPS